MVLNEQGFQKILKELDSYDVFYYYSTAVSYTHLENTQKLEEMRSTVDEKLQKTLEEKLHQSFNRVSQQLESVYKGLGEMQTLAVGVGDLKKVLSNVKTRGILGRCV